MKIILCSLSVQKMLNKFKAVPFTYGPLASFCLFISPCSRVIEAAACKVIVLPVIGEDLGVQLRERDLSWKDFLSLHPR